MSRVLRFFFITLLLSSAVLQSIKLLLFLLFRKKTALATLCFVLLFSISLALVVDQRFEQQLRQQLQLQHSQLQRKQVQQELFFWQELSGKIASPYIFVRISELHTWLGNSVEAENAFNTAKALDPQISLPH